MTFIGPARPIESVAGFTLLEALAATALMAMILAALATITAQWLPNWNRGVARLQGSERIGLALERIAADLSAAEFIAAGRDTRRPVFEGLDRSIFFVRTALGPNTSPSLDVVRIAEVDTDFGPMVVRSRSPFVPIDAKGAPRRPQVFSDPVILLRAPYVVRFAYAGRDRVWQSVWRLQSELPSAIRITLQDSQRERSISTAISVPTKVPVECLAAKSLNDCLTSHLQQSEPSERGNSRS
jgi:general secretion pathway protein J